MATTETRKMVLAAAAVCEEKKAENTRVLELDPADSGFTDFFLITSGTNTRQTVAIADEIEIKMKREFATYANSVEGRRQGEWILMDYVDFVVHIFVEEKRAFYDIERLRKSARSIDVAELTTALGEKTAAARRKHPATPAAAKNAKAAVPPRASGDDKAVVITDADEAGTTPAKSTRRAAATAGKKTAAPKKTAARKVAARKSPAKAAASRSASAKKSPAKKSATRIAAAGEAGAAKTAAKKASGAETKKRTGKA